MRIAVGQENQIAAISVGIWRMCSIEPLILDHIVPRETPECTL
jgi:hypothetical protein